MYIPFVLYTTHINNFMYILSEFILIFVKKKMPVIYLGGMFFIRINMRYVKWTRIKPLCLDYYW